MKKQSISGQITSSQHSSHGRDLLLTAAPLKGWGLRERSDEERQLWVGVHVFYLVGDAGDAGKAGNSGSTCVGGGRRSPRQETQEGLVA